MLELPRSKAVNYSKNQAYCSRCAITYPNDKQICDDCKAPLRKTKRTKMGDRDVHRY